MASWADLDREIERWRRAGEVPTFWWRDDDAQAPTPELDRLIALADRFDAHVHLAVIPKGLHPDLARRLRASPKVWAMQHGFAHINHEPAGLPASEIGVSRELDQQSADLREGWRLIARADLPNLIPCVVPPWNRMAYKTRKALPGMGYLALSAFEGPTANIPVPGLVQIHSHFDPIRWRGGAHFRGTEKTLSMVIEHLEDRRSGRVPKWLPTGLLTHHLETDEDVWAFITEFGDRMAHSRVTDWVPIASFLENH